MSIYCDDCGRRTPDCVCQSRTTQGRSPTSDLLCVTAGCKRPVTEGSAYLCAECAARIASGGSGPTSEAKCATCGGRTFVVRDYYSPRGTKNRVTEPCPDCTPPSARSDQGGERVSEEPTLIEALEFAIAACDREPDFRDPQKRDFQMVAVLGRHLSRLRARSSVSAGGNTPPIVGEDAPKLDWSLCRRILEQGMSIQQDYAAGKYPDYEHLSARLDEAARERVDAAQSRQEAGENKT